METSESFPLKIQVFAHRVVYDVMLVIEIILLLTFVFKLLGANAQNEAVRFLYSAGNIFSGPFVGILGNSYTGNSVLDSSILIAMVFYAFVASLLVLFLKVLR